MTMPTATARCTTAVCVAVARLEGVLAHADLAGLREVLAEVEVHRRRLDAVEVAAAARLEELVAAGASLLPEAELASAAGRPLSHGTRAVDRQRTSVRFTAVGAVFASGATSAAHVDALAAAWRPLEADEREALVASDDRLAEVARVASTEQFRAAVTAEVRRVQADDGTSRLRRQRRATGLRCWVDRGSGMYRVAGQFDPESGLRLFGRLENATDTLFHAATPEDCPSDPQLRQDFLRAHALVALTEGRATSSGRAEVIVTIDHRTLLHGYHDHTRIHTGVPGLELPLDRIRALCELADIVPALLDDQGVVLKLGRTRRLANRHQRRALRAMYRHCPVPGCSVPVGRCEPHHVVSWTGEHGTTDLELLVPLCKHHHDLVHQHRWRLTLGPDRSLIIALPDGTTMHTGPPAEQWT